MSKERVAIGRLRGTRGIRGELFAELATNEPGREERLSEVELALPDRSRTFQIERAWWHQDKLVLKFEGIDSANDAEPWKGAEIRVAPEDVAQPEEGAYSYADLIGCMVETTLHGPIGNVMGVENYGAGPLLLIEDGAGREIMVPFARALLEEVDIAQKRILINPPEGLLDL